MSKFLELCEKVESLLREAGETDPNTVPADPNAATAPAPAVPEASEQPPTGVSDDNNEIHVVTNDEIKEMVLNLSKYLEKNLGESDPLKKKIAEVVPTIDNSDDKIKAVVTAIASIVNPQVENPNVPVKPAEVGGEAQTV